MGKAPCWTPIRCLRTYIADPSEKGSDVKLVVLANGLRSCGTAKDSLLVHVIPLPVIHAGLQGHVCQNSAYTVSGVSVTDYTGLMWTHQGRGSLAGSSTLTPTYTAAAADAGNDVKLVLQVTGNSPCGLVKDSVYIHVDSLPVANAGPSGSMCEGSTLVLTNASPMHYSQVQWSVLSGRGTLQNANSLTPSYSSSANDLSLVQLQMHINGSGTCAGNWSDGTRTVNVTQYPELTAGADGYICADNKTYTFSSAGAQNYDPATIQWQVLSGSGSFSNGRVMNPVYTVGSGDTMMINTQLRFRVNVHGTGDCISASAGDTVVLRIDPVPHSSAGPDVSTCGFLPIHVTGDTSYYHTRIQWSSNGTGIFTDATVMHPVYQPGAGDQGRVIRLILTLTGCKNMTSITSANATIHIPPTGMMSGSDSICQGQSTPVTIMLTGTQPWKLSWEEGGVAQQAGNVSTSPYQFSVTPLVSTQYTLVKVEDTYCPSVTGTATGTADVRVYRYPVPYEVSASNNGAYCASESGVIITLAGSETGINYRMNYNGATQVRTEPGTGTAINFGLVSNQGIYTVLATNPGAGCSTNMTGLANVVKNRIPETDFTGGLACTGKATVFTMTGSYLATLQKGRWQFGDGGYSDFTGSYKVSHNYIQVDTVLVTLTVTDNNGCSDTARHNVSIFKSPESKFAIEEAGDSDIGRINLVNSSQYAGVIRGILATG